MDNKYKIFVARAAREGKTKLELMMQFPKASLNETKEIYLFYQLSKEIINLIKAGESDDVLKRVIVQMGFSENDLDLIKGKKELKSILSGTGTTFVSLIFILLFVFILGSLLINSLGNGDWDFFKKDYQINGMFFGDDTNFDDLKITSNSTIKNVKIVGSEYSATIRCSKEVLISFSKNGFAPIHKKINCESQTLDIVLPLMNEFKKINLASTNSVEDKGIKLDLNGNDLVLIGTNKSPKSAEISLTGFNPNTPGDMQYFPGELEGENNSGEVTALESYGFAKIVVQDENGNYLDFKEGKSATVSFPIDPNQRVDAPSEMPLWYFDEKKAIWVEEGIAKKVCNGNNCEYVGEVTQVRSFHNVDKPIVLSNKDLNGWGLNDNNDCSKGKVMGLDSNAHRKNLSEIKTFDELLQRNPQLKNWYNALVKTEQDTIAAGRNHLVNAEAQAMAFYELNYGGYAFGIESSVFSLYRNYEILPSGSKFLLTNPNTGIVFKGYLDLIGAGEVSSSGYYYPKLNKDYKTPDAAKKVYIEGVPFNMDHVSYTFLVEDDNPAYVVNLQDFLGFPWQRGLWWGNPQNYYGNLLGSNLNPYSPSENDSSVSEGLKNKREWADKESYSAYLRRFLLAALQQIENEPGNFFPPGVQNYYKNRYNTYADPCAREELRKSIEQLNSFMEFLKTAPVVDIEIRRDPKPPTGLFSFSPNDLTFSLFSGINVNEGALFVPIVEDVYLATTNVFTSSYLYPKLIVFSPFAYVKGDKLILVTSSGESELKQSVFVDEFYLEYNSQKEFYKKVGDLFLLDRIELVINSNENSENLDLTPETVFYYYENSNLSKIIKNGLEKKFIYDGDRLIKISYIYENNLLFEYNFFYENSKLSLVSINDFYGSIILNKFNWKTNKLEINSNTNHLFTNFNNVGKVVEFGDISLDYNSSGIHLTYSGAGLNAKQNNYSFVIKGQSMTRVPVSFENIGKPISFSYVGNPQIVFTINNVPSSVVNVSSLQNNGASFGGYDLSNCSFWSGYPLDLANCVIGWDKLNGLGSIEALDYVSTLGLNAKDVGIVYAKLADYFIDLDFCYLVLSKDYYSGLACIKQVDNFKIIYSNQVIPNIVNKNLSDYDLSFVLRNLSEYYMDRNYCLPIPTESKKLACLAMFPEPLIPVVPTNLCGNGVVDGNEKCDGSDFAGKDCSSFGFNLGVLSCYKCQINKGNCSNVSLPSNPDVPNVPSDPDDPDVPVVPTHVCGNNLVEGNEDCDGNNLDGATCADYGFNSGSLSCVNCRVNDDACVNTPAPSTCGNGTIEGNEQCDGANLNGKSCATYGFNTGVLSCNNCQIINSNCSNTAAPPVEIDPLQIFDCNYNANYSSPIKDNTNNSFWIKRIENGKVFGLKIPFKKTSCVGETVLNEDESGNIIPCVTQLNDVDGCILEKRELSMISSVSDNYIAGGKYNLVYKQNPVDFVGGDGNIYFLIKSNGKHEYLKFNTINLEINEKLQVYSESDYSFSTIPNVFRSMPSGEIFWIILDSPLTNVKVENDSYMRINVCKNAPLVESSGYNDESIGYYRWGIVYDYGSIIFGKDYAGVANANIKAKARCDYTEEYLIEIYMGGAHLLASNFASSTMTYAGDGFGNLVVRSNTNIREYSLDSNDVEFPSAIR